MKIPIIVSGIILAAAAVICWSYQGRLDVAEKEIRTLSAKADALGLKIDPERVEGGVRVAKRKREDKGAVAREAARYFIANFPKMKGLGSSSQGAYGFRQSSYGEFTERMLALDAGQLEIVIAELRAEPGMDDEIRMRLIDHAMQALSDANPQAVLALYVGNDPLEDRGNRQQAVSTSLANWASYDPQGAFDWVRENVKNHPELATDVELGFLIRSAAKHDIASAFDILRQVEMKNTGDVITRMAGDVRTPVERSEFLLSLRKFSETTAGKDTSAYPGSIRWLGIGIAEDGFAEGSRWLGGNGLSQDEMTIITGTVFHYAKNEDKGSWLEWMGESLTGENENDTVPLSMSRWASNDSRAAGEWLAGVAEGPLKEAATSSYAETLATYDPTTAVQWAQTLPDGSSRDATLQLIYHVWPTRTPEDKASRAKFAAENGLE